MVTTDQLYLISRSSISWLHITLLRESWDFSTNQLWSCASWFIDWRVLVLELKVLVLNVWVLTTSVCQTIDLTSSLSDDDSSACTQQQVIIRIFVCILWQQFTRLYCVDDTCLLVPSTNEQIILHINVVRSVNWHNTVTCVEATRQTYFWSQQTVTVVGRRRSFIIVDVIRRIVNSCSTRYTYV